MGAEIGDRQSGGGVQDKDRMIKHKTERHWGGSEMRKIKDEGRFRKGNEAAS